MGNRSGRKDETRDVRDWAGRAPRLFVGDALAAGVELDLEKSQAHYLSNVLRLKADSPVLLFNGRDGEWQSIVTELGRKSAHIKVLDQTRLQPAGADIHYLFAPLKHARLDYMVQKAAELGASRLCPVITRRTVAARVNLERMRANVIEAAEQCGNLAPPDVVEPMRLEAALDGWDEKRLMIFADEAAPYGSPVAALEEARGRPLAVLVGPEGGFDEAERRALLGKPFVLPVPLGPRILRADTAAIAALALVQAVAGDWRDANR